MKNNYNTGLDASTRDRRQYRTVLTKRATVFRVWLCFLLLLSADINAQGLSGIASADTASCQGQSTTLIIAASGGTPPYEYSINNGTNWQSSSSFTVTAGTYNQIKVKDASNAETTLSSLVVVDGPAGTTYYVDSDGDGYGVTSTATVLCYDPGFGYSTQSGDCNDANDAIYPGQTEVCNTIDDDCDGSTDEGLPTETYYVDADGDGFGTGNAIVSCADPGLGYSDNNADCNDGNSAVNPSATEICNGIDDNCNGFIDQFDQLLSPQGQVVITAEPLAAQTLCLNTTPTNLTLSVSGGKTSLGYNYQWYSNSTNAYAGSTAIAGQTTDMYTPPTNTAGTVYYFCIVLQPNALCNGDTTIRAAVTVQSVPLAGAINVDTTICSAGNPAAFVSTTNGSGSGTITYRWESNTNLATPSWNAVAGALSATYDVPAGLTVTTQYRRITVSTLNSNVCESSPTAAVQVTVNDVAAGSIGNAQTICEGDNPAAISNATSGTGSGTITYRWEMNTGTGWSVIPGASSSSYDTTALTADADYRRVAISTLNGVACEAISNSVTITVNNMDAGVIAGNQTICEGGDPVAFTSPTAATGDGAITYQWQSSADGVTYANISGATSETYNHGILSADTYFQRVATSTNSVNGAQTCVEISNAILVTVNNMDAGVIAGNQTICEGGDPVAFTSPTNAGGDGVITFRWESSVSPFSSWAAIAGANSSTHDAPSGLGQTTKYRRVAISTLNGLACEAITNLITVTIDSIPTVANSGADIIQCNVADFLLNGNNPSIGIGQWSQLSGDLVTIVTSAAYNSAANGLVAGGIAILRWTISNGVCPASIDDVVLINNQTPDAGAISGVSVECLTATNRTRTYSVASLGGNTSYAWSFPAGFAITSGQGTNSVNVSISNVAIGNGITGNICITASNSSCGSGVASCKAVELQSAAPVTPGSISGPGKICPQESGTYSISLVNRAASYSWTLPTGITQSTGGNTNIITASVGAGFVSSGDMIVTASNICGTGGQRVKLIGQKYPLAPSPITGTASGVCNMNAVTYSTGSSVNATSYSWTIPAGASFVSGNSLNNVTVNFGTSSGAVTVSGVNTCGSGSIRSFTVAVAPGRPASISGLTSVCVNSTNPYTSSTVVGADSYNWLVPSGAVNLSGDVKTIDVQYGAVPALNQIIIVSATNECGTSASRSLAGIAINSCNINREEIVTDGFSALLYPNPMQGAGTLQINCEQDEQLTLRLTDVSGRLIAEKQINVQQGISSHDIRIEGQQPGFYLLQLQSSGISKVIRVIVE